MLKKVTLAILYLLLSVNIVAQEDSIYSRVKIGFIPLEGVINDISGLLLQIRFSNSTKKDVLLFSELVDGMEYDPVGNIYFEIKKFDVDRYLDLTGKYCDYFFNEFNPAPRREFQILKPDESVVLGYKLVSRTGYFDKGRYKMRVNVLVPPRNPNSRYDMVYQKSDWMYFEVTQDIFFPKEH